MKLQVSPDLDVERMFHAMADHEVLIVPTDLGYAMTSMTAKGVNLMYKLKGRPLDKPSGVLATKKIFSETTISDYGHEVDLIDKPLGIIERWNPASPQVAKLPALGKHGNSMALFVNLDERLEQLAEYAYLRGRLIVVTSANKAGEGNCYQLKDIAPDIRERCAVVIDGGISGFKLTRSSFEAITTTMVNLTNRKFARPGVFALDLIEECAGLGMIHRREVRVFKAKKGQIGWRSAMFLRTFSESAFKKLPNLYDSDWIILDLEDGCPRPQVEDARQLISKYINTDIFEGHNVALRLNPLDDRQELVKDLNLNYTRALHAFILPMLRTAEDVGEFERMVSNTEARLNLEAGTFKFIPLIETAQGIQNVREIAAASRRNVAMILGHADLFGETQGERDADNLHWIRTVFLNAAKAAGLKAWDTPYETVTDINGLRDDCKAARRVGMDGKIALHPYQLDVINRAFGISSLERRKYKRAIDNFDGGCYMDGDEFLGAPIIKKFKLEHEREVYIPRSRDSKGIRPRTFKYGARPEDLHPGRVFRSKHEVTLDTSWITHWQSLVPTFNPIDTSGPFCAQLGLKDRLVPYHLLINLSLCLAVESFSESCLFHLGISNVVYEKPMYTGDTLKTEVRVVGLKKTANDKFSVVTTKLLAFNQWDEVVLSMDRKSLFRPLLHEGVSEERLRHTVVEGLKSHVLRKSAGITPLADQNEFVPGEVIAHSLVRPMGISANVNHSLLHKNTHPLHINTSRFAVNDLVVSGGFVMPMVVGAAMRDLKYAVHEKILSTQHINPLKPEESLGAYSFVVSSKKEGSHECLTLRTFGVKGIDPDFDLAQLRIPHELVDGTPRKPKEIETICHEQIPELAGRICVLIEWQMWRK